MSNDKPATRADGQLNGILANQMTPRCLRREKDEQHHKYPLDGRTVKIVVPSFPFVALSNCDFCDGGGWQKRRIVVWVREEKNEDPIG